MPNQCKQYKEDFEKLLALKQEFDAALENGVKSRNFDEAKSVKIELEKVLRDLELDLKFKVWKTIELGTGLKTAANFSRALKRGGCEITDSIKFIMKQPGFTVLSEKTNFELVITTGAELGFSSETTLEEFFKRAQEMGLELCPPEVGPQLRLQYKDQTEDDLLRIAMEKIEDCKGHFGIFRLGNDGSPWLETYYDNYIGNPNYQWVFVKRKLKE